MKNQPLIIYVNSKRVEDENVDPECTLLNYLRLNLKLRGTKLGCAEGGCGACTVMISRYDHITKKILHYSANACLMPICAVYGCAITTVEGIGSLKTKLHPVQERLAHNHGSQCGFCTPGIVMSMYTLLRNKTTPTMHDVETYMQGNLCRCTGYRSIWEAFRTFTKEGGCKSCQNQTIDDIENVNKTCAGKIQENGNDNKCPEYSFTSDEREESEFPEELKRLNIEKMVQFKSERISWYRPINLTEILNLRCNNPHSKIVVGNSEIGIETKFKNALYTVLINPILVPEMNELAIEDTGIRIGAAVNLSEVTEFLEKLVVQLPDYKTKIFRAMLKMLNLFAGVQIRNMASIAGNIMTASPISDLNPLLMAAGAVLDVQSTDSKRNVKMDDKFFISYRRTCIKDEELVSSIFIPFTLKDEYFFGYKQSRRREDDISIVNAGMRVRFEPESDIVADISLAFGGMAATSLFAKSTMQKLQKRHWNESLFESACQSLMDDLPLSPSAPGGMIEYRKSLTLSFFFKFYLTVLKTLSASSLTDLKVSQNDECAIRDIDIPEFSSSQIYKIPENVNGNETVVGKPLVHMSALKQTTGEAVYIDDIPKFADELYVALLFSSKGHAKIINIDASESLKMPGVLGWMSSKDLDEKKNTTGPVFKDEEVFASKKVTCQGQVIAAVVAKDQSTAQRAVKMIKVDYEDLPVIISIEDAIANNSYLGEELIICNGDVVSALDSCNHTIESSMRVAGQEHFYLETNASLAIPKNEDGEMELFCSSQNLSATQQLAADALGVPSNKVTCKVKRLGGGFGGKETRFHILSNVCAIAAQKFGRPVRCMLDRDEDMISTGTRHSFLAKYKVGFDSDGKIEAMDVQIFCNVGNSYDLSKAVLERAMFHFENSYKFATVKCRGRLCKTNTPSNTAFRGFGGPQGMFAGEDAVEKISTFLKLAPEDVRRKNLYRENDLTHYNQKVENCTLAKCWDQCIQRSDYPKRKLDVQKFNEQNRWKKRGISVVPTKFGISFTAAFLNQAGALVHVYKDGSVLISHGGVEMGQGLHTKMIQIASTVFGIDAKEIHISETSTDKVPNTSPTAASASSDLYGMAIKVACEKIMKRLEKFRASGGTWKEWIIAAYFDRVSLSATGFYSTPNLGYDWDTNQGNVFAYYTFGVACSEVEIDCLTGDHKVLRTDIVMDIGESLNPAIDIGQIEGGFIQGYGLFVLEEPKYSPSGFLFTRGPGTYKIPGFTDIPGEFNVALLSGAKNPRAVYSSKAVGEPPLFLASSIYFAIKQAIYSARCDNGETSYFSLNSPATSERIRNACSDPISNKFKVSNPASYTPWDVSP